ncbi:endonuclease/exonuclease/phosphatase family protein [Legionella sp. D16C41]|uniref:endonuclease/exonuclease/phosphatase family protein n=1 Tax=Legionella sp. D16C41 TaxID=3402688 RepID=UPI003AF48EDC
MKQPRQSVSLVTYNIHKGFGVGKLRFLLPEMRYALSKLNPDFVFLQEVQGSHQRRAQRIQTWPDLPQFEYIAEKEWPHYLYAKNAIYQSGHHGNAILSKYPFVSFENINVSRQNRASRSILHGQIKLDNNQILHLLCVHLGLFKAERASQCRALVRRIIDAIPDNEPLLMAGDFNDWQMHLSQPLSDALGIQEAFKVLDGQHARSFPALKPTLCIDRIYYRGLTAEKAQCFSGKPWRTLSDHLPLFAKFHLI